MFVFSGRSTRTEVVAFFVLGVLANMMTITIDGPAQSLLDAAKQVWWLLWSFPWIALFVRRLHDQGHSGWLSGWWWLASSVYAAVAILLALQAPEAPGSKAYLRITDWVHHTTWVHHFAVTSPVIAFVIIAFVLVGVQIFLLLASGTPGPNRYGPDPRE